MKHNTFQISMAALTSLTVCVVLTGCGGQQSGSEDPAQRSKAYADCLSRQTQTGEDCSKYQSP
jgi:hypothetical protein